MRYNKRSLETVIETLREWSEQTEETLGNVITEAREELLQTRLDALNSAIEALEDIE